MSEAVLFRQHAKEAIDRSSKVKDENEKQALVDVAFTWALTALKSDRVLGSRFVLSLCDVGEVPRPFELGRFGPCIFRWERRGETTVTSA